MSEPIFFHVDVNSAFLSWTACDLLFNKEIDYDLRLVPSIIGGNQATRHSSHQMTLSSPTDITEKIYIAACMLFDELWDGSPIRQLGVHTSRASFEAYYQYDLFDGARIDKLRAMDLTVDSIRDRYGYESIKRACFTKE